MAAKGQARGTQFQWRPVLQLASSGCRGCDRLFHESLVGYPPLDSNVTTKIMGTPWIVTPIALLLSHYGWVFNDGKNHCLSTLQRLVQLLLMEEILHHLIPSYPLAPLNIHIVFCAGCRPNMKVANGNIYTTHLPTPTLRLRGWRRCGYRTLFRMPVRVVQDFRPSRYPSVSP